MKNTFGNTISLTIFGESHGPAIGAILDGLPAGFEIDMDKLYADIDKRRPRGKTGTQRHEADEVKFVSGVFNGKTTGTALTIIIENQNTKSQDYANIQYRLRPGHADFSAWEKYGGFQDYRGGGHFSGRLTAAVVAAGSICRQILDLFGIHTGTHILKMQELEDEAFSDDMNTLASQIEALNNMDFAVLNPETRNRMFAKIEAAAADKDSVGGVLQTVITGLPAGIGEPFFDSVESELSHLLFSVPAVKGISFGEGFGFADLFGSQANDEFVSDGQNITTKTNHNGGINGGITNGMPVLFQTVIKPTASIFKEQHSVDYRTKENVTLTIQGRHDPAIIHRARVVVDCITAFGILDLWMTRLGTESLQDMLEIGRKIRGDFA